ncbi:MAG: glycosyltransferase family 39 protein [Elusimicrobiaceae bacterium]|nr:glycosyltransferase family 39 protein [Elusimicrobiaceae bacterium]
MMQYAGSPFIQKMAIKDILSFPAFKPDRLKTPVLAAVLLFAIMTTVPFFDTCFRHSFEPDSAEHIATTTAFMQAILKLDPDRLDRPGLHPYGDAQYYFYSGAGLALKAAAAVLNLPAAGNDTSLSILAIRLVSAGADVAAILLLFLLALKLTRSRLAAAMLAVLFALNPQMRSVDLLRIDHLIPPLGIFSLLLCLSILQNPGKARNFAFLGITLALLVNTKITAAVFLPPALYALWRAGGKTAPGNIKSAAYFFLMASLLLSLRIIYAAPSVPALLSARFAHQSAHHALLSVHPYLFYSVNEFHGYGFLFLPLSAATLIVTAYAAFRLKEQKAALTLWAFVPAAVSGLFMPKLSHWGIYYPVMQLLVAGYGLGYLGERFKAGKQLYWRLCAIALGLSALSLNNHSFGPLAAQARARARSIEQTRTRPAQWLREHARPGDRLVCYAHSWANPPVYELGLKIGTEPLNYPYLCYEKLKEFYPPDIDSLSADTDYVLLENIHKTRQLRQLDTLGLAAQAQAWRLFYKQLAGQFPPLVFQADYPNYGLSRVEIFPIKKPRPATSEKQSSAMTENYFRTLSGNPGILP